MLKTNNFDFPVKVSQFFLTLCLLVVCASLTPAQTGAAKPAQSSSPSSAVTSERPHPSEPVVSGSKTTQTVIDPSIPNDAAVMKMLEPYSAKVRALDVVIGKLEGELKKGGLGAGSLGNFVTDGMRAQASARLGAPIDLVVSNSGGLRKNSIAPGDLRIRDIFELLPFENSLFELELTGEQLLKVLQVAVADREPQSGARVKYRTNAENKLELVSADLVTADGKEREINPAAGYRVISIDYLLNVSGGNFAILEQSKVRKPLGITIRDAMIEYVKVETAAGRTIKAKLDGRFRREGPGQENEP